MIESEFISYIIVGLTVIAVVVVYAATKYQTRALADNTEPRPTEWTGDLEHTAYLYYQGMSVTQVQAARYIETNSMVLTTGEQATSRPSGVNTIPRDRLWVYPEIQEIQRNTTVGLLGRFEHLMHSVRVGAKQSSLSYPSLPPTNTPLYPTDESGTLHHYSVNKAQCVATIKIAFFQKQN